MGKENVSPSASPPRKKHEGSSIETEIPDNEDEMEVVEEIKYSDIFNKDKDNVEDIEMVDIESEAKELIRIMQENRIKELEVTIKEMKEQKVKDDLKIIKLETQIEKLRSISSQASTKIKSLSYKISKVHDEYLPFLKGFNLRYRATPDGACVTNSAAIHIFEDEDEGPKLKRLINNYIADNWDNYFVYKIPLPYTETVGVGKHSKTIIKTTKEELLEFLRSEESLLVFTDTQELLAIANIFNIKINVFTFGEFGHRWSEVHPDPDMTSSSAEQDLGKVVPDMFLYHSNETHYDLLVRNDSRLAALGPLAGVVLDNEKEDQVASMKDLEVETEPEKPKVSSEEWETVNRIKKNRNQPQTERKNDEILLQEEVVDSDVKSIDETLLFNSKLCGKRRASPQEEAEDTSMNSKIYKCDKCEQSLESFGLLVAHKAEAHDNRIVCSICRENVNGESDLKKHIEDVHVIDISAPTINKCKKCKFEFQSEGILKAHMKNHTDIKLQECDFCDAIFYNKTGLNNHLNSVHTAEKMHDEWPCNDCPFQASSSAILMKHLQITGHQPSKSIINGRKDLEDYRQCYTCKMDFNGFNNLMNHRKAVHPSNKKCWDFQQGECTRGQTCWYVHGEELEESLDKFNCDDCGKVFKGRSKFMRHKKFLHKEKVPICENFRRKKCQRTDNDCWFQHKNEEKKHF